MPEASPDLSRSDGPRKSTARVVRTWVGRLAFVGFAVIACSLIGLEATEALGEPDACTMCHEMQEAYDSWVQSPHVVNSSGVKVRCIACHLPPREDYVAHVWGKVRAGAKDGYVHFFGEYDAEAARQAARDDMPSLRCIRCHDNLLGKPSSPAVGIVHGVSLKQVPQPGYACVACHDDLHGAKGEPVINKAKYELADNSYCQVCHIDFDGEEFTEQHRSAGIGCTGCHGDSEPHADDEEHLTAPDVMYPKDAVNASCAADECHSETLLKKHRGHRPFYANAPSDKTYCTDCHGKHRKDKRTRTWNKATGKLIWTDGESLKSDGMDGMSDM